MQNAERIKAFVNVKLLNGKYSVVQVSQLFERLVENVKNEYKNFHNNREQPKINNVEIDASASIDSLNQAAYLHDENFIDFFTKVKDRHELPFSITQEIKSSKLSEDSAVLFPTQNILRTCYFVTKSLSRETFYQIQRQHKIWWMKCGSSPGRYKISDLKTDSNLKYMNIVSSAADSPINVERLGTYSLKDCIKGKENLNNFLSRAPNRKKETVPEVIETVIDLQVAAFALLMDAVNLSNDYTNLHRRSAPYQLALITDGTSSDVSDLARYIQLLIEATDKKIQVLNEPQSTKKSKEDCFKRYDQIGVPYTIIVNDESLKFGFLKLRNRNTTLSETIHLSDVTNYLIKIFSSG